LEALGKTYEEKTDTLRKDNFTLAQENNDLKTERDDARMQLVNTNINLIKEREQNITLMSQIRKLTEDQRRLVMALVVRDEILQKRLGIKLPMPFDESDNNPQTPSQPQKTEQ
jgi:hypothetical protein